MRVAKAIGVMSTSSSSEGAEAVDLRELVVSEEWGISCAVPAGVITQKKRRRVGCSGAVWVLAAC